MGYAIKREVALRTNGKYRLGPGTLYGAIKRMLAQGLIEESDVRPDAHLDDWRRHYYRLTSLGTCAAKAELDRMRDILLASSSKPLLARIVKDHWIVSRPRLAFRENLRRPLPKLYPGDFRREFGDQIHLQFREECWEERCKGGWLWFCSFGCAPFPIC